MKKILFGFILASCFLLLASASFADDEYRSLIVDLKGKGFSQSAYQDNLQSSDIIFGPGDKFQLQLKISNEGNRNQTNVDVREALPSSVTSDAPVQFTIPQIAAGEDYIKNIVVTVKGSQFIFKDIKNNSIRFTAKSEIGTEGGDYFSFFTGNGTKTATSSGNTLPNTGAETFLIGSGLSSVLAFVGFKLRKLARGY